MVSASARAGATRTETRNRGSQREIPLTKRARAESEFQRALELYQEQDFAGALVEFRRANTLAPSYKLLFNIGQVCYQLNDYACALNNFEQYKAGGGNALSSERRVEVDKELAKLRLRVGRLEVVSNLPGVDVSIDDVSVGKTPLPASVIVSTGKRRISGTHEGFSPVSRIVEVAGTDSSRIELTFSGAVAGLAEAPRYEPRWNSISWMGLGVTAVAVGITGFSGVVALNADKDLKRGQYAEGQPIPASLSSTQARAQTFSVVSDVTLGISIAALVGTLAYTFLRTPHLLQREKTPSSGPSKAALGVGFGLGGNGAISGNF